VTSTQNTPAGIDAPGATKWLASAVPALEPPLAFARIGDGQSNLSYLVRDAVGRAVVLRRPPLGHLLPSAHDMAREYRILSALAAAGAAVPRTLALCEDAGVLGAPFYVMEYARGLIMRSVATAEALSPAARDVAGRSLATTLSDLHSVDLDAVGLGELRRPESLASRQLRRWTKQWHASKTRELPLIDELAERLRELVPPERETVLVHGDYRLDNVVFDASGAARAVLDWELATTGDPLADVGLMVVYWYELGRAAREPGAVFPEPVTELSGFPSAAQLAAAYAAACGRDLAALGVWVAFGYWKLAIIIEGVYRRWLNDPVNGAGAGTFGPAVPRLAENARRALERNA
jgi:aminoglycoside phosphotransferase (APT) family kinase protein